MNRIQMKSLFFYEVKKIAGRRIVAVSMVCAVLLIIFTFCVPFVGDYYVDGERISSNYENFQIDIAYAKALDGRKIDDRLIKEMQEAYCKVDLEAYRYSLSEEYQTYARPYSAIFNFVRQSTGLSGKTVVEKITGAKDVQDRRMFWQEKRWNDLELLEEEKEFWRSQEKELSFPVTFRYIDGYAMLFDACYTIGIVGLFVVAACMSGVFPWEQVRKTDQLILSSRYGRNHIFWMKFLAGIWVSFLMIMILVLIAFGMAFWLYGVEGFEAAFQMYYVGSSLSVSIGEAVLLTYIIEVITVVFMAGFVMILSAFLRSSVGTLAVATAMIVAPMMISVPEQYRFFSQLWSAMPGEFVAIWSIFDARTVVLFGKVFTMWQVVPAGYLLFSICLAVLASKHFAKQQISGR